MSVFDRNTVSAEQVLGFDFQAYEGASLTKMSIEFDGKISLDHLLSWIGDTNIMGEFPNNFTIRLLIKIDNETTALITEEVDAQPNVCDECSGTEEFTDDTQHSCGHISDEITIINSVHIVGVLSDNEKSTFLTFE